MVYLVILTIGGYMSIEQQFKKGSMDMILLSLVNRRKTYGYEILQTLKTSSNLFKNIKEGTIYPVLYRLEDDGLIINNMEIVNGRKKKTYTITELGRSTLNYLIEFWRVYKLEIDKCLGDYNE